MWDTEQEGEKLVNRRLKYAAASRGRYDAQIYLNDKARLAEGPGRDVRSLRAGVWSRALNPYPLCTKSSRQRSSVHKHAQAEPPLDDLIQHLQCLNLILSNRRQLRECVVG